MITSDRICPYETFNRENYYFTHDFDLTNRTTNREINHSFDLKISPSLLSSEDNLYSFNALIRNIKETVKDNSVLNRNNIRKSINDNKEIGFDDDYDFDDEDFTKKLIDDDDDLTNELIDDVDFDYDDLNEEFIDENVAKYIKFNPPDRSSQYNFLCTDLDDTQPIHWPNVIELDFESKICIDDIDDDDRYLNIV